MATGIPLLLIGKGPAHIEAVIQILKPEFHVIQSCTETSEAAQFLSSVMKGENVNQQTYPEPSVVVMGGAFNNNDYDIVRGSLEGVKNQIIWFRPVNFQPGYSGGPPQGGPPTPEMVAARIRTAVDDNMTRVTSGEAVGEVIYY